MKNDSPFFPMGTPMDSFFDSNHDGNLSGMETAFRDANLMESYNHFVNDSDSSYCGNNQSSGYSAHSNPPKRDISQEKFITTVFTDESKKDYSNPPSNLAIIISSIAVVAVCLIAFLIVLNGGNDNSFLNSLVMFGAVGAGVCILKLFGVIAPNKKADSKTNEFTDDSTDYYDAVNDCFKYGNDCNESDEL